MYEVLVSDSGACWNFSLCQPVIILGPPGPFENSKRAPHVVSLSYKSTGITTTTTTTTTPLLLLLLLLLLQVIFPPAQNTVGICKWITIFIFTALVQVSSTS
jgi:hypothetical protein